MRKEIKVYIDVVYNFLILIFFINLNYQLGMLSDNYNSSPDALLGGIYWLNLTWVMLVFSFVMLIVAIVKVVKMKTSKQNQHSKGEHNESNQT